MKTCHPARHAVFIGLIGSLGLAAHVAHAASETTTYVFVSDNLGEPGRQVVERGDDGLTTVTYLYKNNGRGPELTERYRLAPDGSYSELHVTGTSTYGAAVDEHFERQGATATWRSTSERGSTQTVGAAMYSPLNSSYDPISVAITALAKSANHEMALLPSGTLRHRVVDDIEVENAGRKQHVQLISQTGIGLQPFFIWATTGPAPRLFAVDDLAGELFIEAGWQGNRKLMAEHQKAAEQSALRERAARLRHPLTGLTVIRNARLFDSETATLGDGLSDVYVLRGRITALRPAGSDVDRRGTDADTDIDAAGRVMLPGLFDMHGHAWRWEGALDLAAGVTSVRDMGNDNTAMQQMLDDAAAGRLLMPQLLPCGFIEGRSPFSSSNGITITTLAEAKAAVDWYALRGYRQIKIYNSFPKAVLKETVAYAHRRGLRVSGHVPAFLRAQDVVEQGFDEIQHINQVLLNFLVTPTTDTRTLQRFQLPAELAGSIDFDSKPVRDFIKLLQRHKTVIDSTLATFDFIKQKDGDMAAPYADVADHMPPDVRRGFAVASLNIPDEATLHRNEKSYAKMVEFVGRMYRAGIPLVAGTDALPGFALHAELALYVQAGLTPSQVLQVATRNGARYSGTSADRGSISVGKLADLVLVDGDPTKRITDLHQTALVITQGQWLSPKELHEDLGIAPFVQAVPEVRVRTAAP